MSDQQTQPPNAITAVPSKKLQVGINYKWAWTEYGSYFGSTDRRKNAWLDLLPRNLRYYKNQLNVSHVRIFMYCNLANFFENYEIRKRTPKPPLPHDWYEISLPRAPWAPYAQEFEKMLQIFRSEKMFVIPSFVDFGAALVPKHDDPDERKWPFSKGHGAAGGCRELWTDPVKRERFFVLALDPLLKVAKEFNDCLHSFEVMNEPIWAADGFSRYTNNPVPLPLMNEFLRSALQRIKDAGVRHSTVGHRFHGDLKQFETGTLRQFHYYPRGDIIPPGVPLTEGSPSSLPDFSETQAFIGEFAAMIPQMTQFGSWPEIDPNIQLMGRRRNMLERLKTLEKKGYRLALIWSDIPDTHIHPDKDEKMSEEAEKGLIDFQKL